MRQDNLFDLIKLSIWGKGNPMVDYSVYQEMKSQAIAVLPASILYSLDLPSELMVEWKNIIIQQIAHFEYYSYIQSHLPIKVPYVILKGTAAAQYYPHPEYRSIGDIDIITRREDYEACCEEMINNTWCETTNSNDKKRGRHRSFEKHGVIVEIHAFFASVNDINKAKALDDLIIGNITDNHYLPDLVNGLVLIDHINQHMEEGIGLRQIIDWMMFVDKCLSDDRWAEFETMAEKTGLKKLAITTTRMCEIYLGLSEHKWCSEADDKLSRKLMEYIMKCGNFGSKLNQTDALYIYGLHRFRHPILAIRELQNSGYKNLAITKIPILRPFAWIMEACRHIFTTPNMYRRYQNAREINALFKSLEVSRGTDGLVFYEDGRYYLKTGRNQ